ncbi:hypothetical protein C8R44DRAFT_752898 [Mycena epipterygia]|nr:hypothetical protein C8R44DRAFT_752898 [Mycena epipterygia]
MTDLTSQAKPNCWASFGLWLWLEVSEAKAKASSNTNYISEESFRVFTVGFMDSRRTYPDLKHLEQCKNDKPNREAWTKAKPNQALLDGLDFGFKDMKPKLDGAKPKPGFQANPSQTNHYPHWPATAYHLPGIGCYCAGGSPWRD